MKERPIIFTASSVRAILVGNKTQTRRVVKPQPFDIRPAGGTFAAAWNEKTAEIYEHFHCPYGQPGDRLWVRETARAIELPSGLDGVEYIADGHFKKIKNTELASDLWSAMHNYRGGSGLKVPPIHMPRWASRINLEITTIRVERLQKISEADALAEGVTIPSYDRNFEPVTIGGFTSGAGRIAYKELWESIHGPDAWATNPYVWVVEFRKL